MEYQSVDRYSIHLYPDDNASIYVVSLKARDVSEVLLPDDRGAKWRFGYLKDASTQNMQCLQIRLKMNIACQFFGCRAVVVDDREGYLGIGCKLFAW